MDALAPDAGKTSRQYLTRRTFAIISHPDAGKTTLTEHLLSESGAILQAGNVRARGAGSHTRSDWLAIEQKRGISVTSSVMTFERDGITFNLLDTPGHSDFSEDTYRTLTAVDAAIMVVDAAKGLEQQTLKLFEVCRLRDIPILTFINKIDREGRDPLELLDEISSTLALDVTPMLWPIGMGTAHEALYDLRTAQLVETVRPLPGTARRSAAELAGLPQFAGNTEAAAAFEMLDLVRGTLPPFDLESFRAGHLTPVYFGSALKHFGVVELLSAIADWAPPPRPQPAEPAPISPDGSEVTGFVFKVQANMDPKHRDRVAFLRLCSGTFRRGMKLTNRRSGKEIAVSSPMFFFAHDRELAEEAVAGDVVGIPNHGTLSVGDTLTQSSMIKVTGIPNFAPEIIERIRFVDAMKSKQLAKALSDLSEEGVAQLFRPMLGAGWLVGVVGRLQLDVLAARLASEYNIEIGFEPAGYQMARWVHADDPDEMKRFIEANRTTLCEDHEGAPAFLARDGWWLERAQKDWPHISFRATKERS